MKVSFILLLVVVTVAGTFAFGGSGSGAGAGSGSAGPGGHLRIIPSVKNDSNTTQPGNQQPGIIVQGGFGRSGRDQGSSSLASSDVRGISSAQNGGFGTGSGIGSAGRNGTA